MRTLTDGVATGLAVLSTVLVVAPLVAVFIYLIYRGASSLSWDFFTQIPKPVGEAGGGMANAIVGSAILLAVGSLIGIPVGIAGGIFLAEYGRGTKFANAIRFTADVLNGVPSIVMGIAVYSLLVVPKFVFSHRILSRYVFHLPNYISHHFASITHFLHIPAEITLGPIAFSFSIGGHFSALSGGVALGIMMIPTVCRTTEEMLLMVPNAVREAALALGVPNWRSVLAITVRTASPGIITGCMLAFARVAGETAPLIFTAFGNVGWSMRLNEPIAALPLQIYVYALSPYDEWHRLAWAGALVLIVLIVLAVSLVRYVTSRGVLKGAS
jgi:phosphate transport system permease protein